MDAFSKSLFLFCLFYLYFFFFFLLIHNKTKNPRCLTTGDPFVVLYDGVTRQVLGQTECIRETRNPEFVKALQMEYCFERVQQLLFIVYDSDAKTVSVATSDKIGELSITLAEILVRHTGAAQILLFFFF